MNAVVKQDVFKDIAIDRLARYFAADVPHKQIAQVFGLSEGRVSQLEKTEEIISRVAELHAQHIEKNEDLNEGWDAVEEESLATVITNLRSNPDPDYALRAAVAANKAQRRPGVNGRATINGNNTATAVIHLNATFVERLQAIQVGQQALNENAKRIDRLSMSKAEHILQPEDTVNRNLNDLVKIFSE